MVWCHFEHLPYNIMALETKDDNKKLGLINQ